MPAFMFGPPVLRKPILEELAAQDSLCDALVFTLWAKTRLLPKPGRKIGIGIEEWHALEDAGLLEEDMEDKAVVWLFRRWADEVETEEYLGRAKIAFEEERRKQREDGDGNQDGNENGNDV